MPRRNGPSFLFVNRSSFSFCDTPFCQNRYDLPRIRLTVGSADITDGPNYFHRALCQQLGIAINDAGVAITPGNLRVSRRVAAIRDQSEGFGSRSKQAGPCRITVKQIVL